MSKVFVFLITLLLALLVGCAPAAATNPAPTTAAGTGYPADSGTPVVQATPSYPPGYPPPSTPEPIPAATGYPALSETGLQVVASDGSVKTFTFAYLMGLPKTTIGNESGPKLMDVLQLDNIFDFSSVTLTGSNGSKDLSKDQVNDQVILSLNNGSCTLIIGNAPVDQPITDITLIKVK